jgi:hypothetical protein
MLLIIFIFVGVKNQHFFAGPGNMIKEIALKTNDL